MWIFSQVTPLIGGKMMFRLACLMIIGAVSGCGGARTSSVEGDVVWDGKPLAGASVQFVPQGKGRDATAGTDKNGHFVMSTFQPKDGMLPGSYKVVISPPVGEADTTTYGSADDAMSAAAKKPAKKDPAAKTFPEKYSRLDQTPLTQEVPVKGKLKFELKN
jgi:hypothetical protein